MVKNYSLGVFIQQNEVKKIVSYIDIQNQKGELFYRFPFDEVNVNLDFQGRKSKDLQFDHISFHTNGTINLTPKKVRRKGQEREILEDSSTRLAIKDVGSQHIITDYIKDISIHPEKQRKLNREIVFNVDKSINSVFIRIDLLSGRNYISNNFNKIPFEDENGKYISEEFIPLGPNSGNSDKVFIVSIFEYKKPETISTNRRLFIPKFSGIPVSKL